MKRLLPLAFATALLPVPALADRVVSIGGAITEIVFALGEEDRLVARDTTSNYPAEALDLPDVGYIRQLSPEGVLSVAPDLIISEAGAGPVETVDLLEEARIPFVTMPDGYDAAAVRAKILAVADALGVPEKGADLAGQVDAELDAAAEIAAQTPTLRVLFVLSTSGGRVMAAGENTSADAVIGLAGGVNALTGIEGFKQISDEAITAAAPDVILMMNPVSDHSATSEEILDQPAIAATPAGADRALIRMDGMKLLGFGPRIGEAVGELALAFAEYAD